MLKVYGGREKFLAAVFLFATINEHSKKMHKK